MQQREKSICIIHLNKFAFSETFIHNHITHLPGKKYVIYGSEQLCVQHGKRDKALVPLPVRLLVRHCEALRDKLRSPPENKKSPARLDAASACLLSRFLRRNRVDAVLAEYGMTGARVMNSCRSAGVPLVVHFHGGDAHSNHVLNTYRDHYRVLFRQAAAIVVVSRAMEQQIADMGAPADAIHYSPYGVDTGQFTVTRPDMNPPVFIAVGRFVDKKAPHLVLLAFQQALKSCPDIRLVMVGEGHLREACRQMVCAFGLQGSVELSGAKSSAEISQLLKSARAFVQHSVSTSWSDSEGTPVSLLEAGATGLPVISTRHAGIPEIVIHGKTGYMVDEFDVTAMAEHIVHLANSPSAARALGENARQHIERQYSLTDSIQRLYSIIDRASQSRAGAA